MIDLVLIVFFFFVELSLSLNVNYKPLVTVGSFLFFGSSLHHLYAYQDIFMKMSP